MIGYDITQTVQKVQKGKKVKTYQQCDIRLYINPLKIMMLPYSFFHSYKSH